MLSKKAIDMRTRRDRGFQQKEIGDYLSFNPSVTIYRSNYFVQRKRGITFFIGYPHSTLTKTKTPSTARNIPVPETGFFNEKNFKDGSTVLCLRCCGVLESVSGDLRPCHDISHRSVSGCRQNSLSVRASYLFQDPWMRTLISE
jgi:hypothetical protein